MLISFLVIGNLGWAGTIAATDVATKIGLFYLHERAWSMIPAGVFGDLRDRIAQSMFPAPALNLIPVRKEPPHPDRRSLKAGAYERAVLSLTETR